MTRTEFEHISGKMRDRLVALARRFTKAVELSGMEEDIVQEALSSLWQLSEQGYRIRNPEALAVKITKNLCVAHYRRCRIHTDGIGQRDFEGGFPAEERTDRADIAGIRSRLYAGLTSTQRMYMQMRNEGGLTLDEIAARTGKPKSSIKTTISTARRQLLEKLKKEES